MDGRRFWLDLDGLLIMSNRLFGLSNTTDIGRYLNKQAGPRSLTPHKPSKVETSCCHSSLRACICRPSIAERAQQLTADLFHVGVIGSGVFGSCRSRIDPFANIQPIQIVVVSDIERVENLPHRRSPSRIVRRGQIFVANQAVGLAYTFRLAPAASE